MQTNIIHEGNSINNDRPNVVKASSHFPQTYQVAGTYRFGEIAPFFCKEAVKGDHDPLQSSHNLRSLNLKSPLMSGLTLKKDFYQVPYEAILPFNWEKVFTQPINGDDVPKNVACNVKVYYIYNLIDRLCQHINAIDAIDSQYAFTNLLREFIILDMIAGDGSLPSSLNLHFDRIFDVYTDSGETRLGWTAFYDSFMSRLASRLEVGVNFLNPDGTEEGVIYHVSDEPKPGYEFNLSWREFLFKCQDNLVFSFTGSPGDWAQRLNIINNILNEIHRDGIVFSVKSYDHITDADVINIAPLWAYQLCSYEFYVNDRIDDLYSAQLFRQYIGYLVSDNVGISYFSYNGLDYQYDFLSGHYFDEMIVDLSSDLGDASTNTFAYFCALFKFNRSLRYVDYFTGAKTRPLAIGDVSVSAAGGSVSIIDTVQKTQFARFLQNVNRIGRKWSNYLAGLFPGGAPAYDWHSPKWLGHTADGISALETQNTGDAQMNEANSVTSNLRTNASRYAFHVEIDRPSILIGLQYFDIPRFYMTTFDRMYWHTDRYEMFNPDLQFIGDQPIYKNELYHVNDFDAPFGYQSRYMEYKQSYNYGFGGFKDNLPSWIFKADDKLYGKGTSLMIGSDYIRSRCSELDPYFVSLTGYSNGSYWHFIQINTNGYDPKRPMVASPGLL